MARTIIDITKRQVESLNLLTPLLNYFVRVGEFDRVIKSELGTADSQVSAELLLTNDEMLRIVAEGDRLWLEFIDCEDECYSYEMRDISHCGDEYPYTSQRIVGLSVQEVRENLERLEVKNKIKVF